MATLISSVCGEVCFSICKNTEVQISKEILVKSGFFAHTHAHGEIRAKVYNAVYASVFRNMVNTPQLSLDNL